MWQQFVGATTAPFFWRPRLAVGRFSLRPAVDSALRSPAFIILGATNGFCVLRLGLRAQEGDEKKPG